MNFFYAFLIVTTIASCGSTDIKPKETSESSSNNPDTSTIDKSKFDPKWVDDITEMADTDDWVALSDDDHFTLVQVLTSRTNRHYILYSKDAEFDINGLAWMKIKAPSCLDVHVYNCDVDKLNFSIRDSYSTDFAFEKLDNFLDNGLLKTQEPISVQQSSFTEKETLRDEIKMRYDEMEMYLDSISGANNEAGELNLDEINSLKQDIRKILNDRNAASSDLHKAKRLVSELDKKIKSIKTTANE